MTKTKNFFPKTSVWTTLMEHGYPDSHLSGLETLSSDAQVLAMEAIIKTGKSFDYKE
ncbi:MAG: hypothetical protein HQK50_17910 [Oligoflexia bacterium]|nr:hypothetical protein [Oligoflexia bacterium]